MESVKDIWKNIKLMGNLAVNDITTKYSGSYFGVTWAFVQPVINTMIYVFIFQIGFKAAPLDNGYPYVLWLIAGIVPWFFFSEAVTNAANVFAEYSYLVKKVVFPIFILPCVRILSALFIHLFFVFLAVLIFVVMGRFPSIQLLQIIYYMFCMIIFILAVSYFTSSIVPFFKDFKQIVSIVLQLGMWLTPIMWDFSIMNLGRLEIIFKINPMFYIVNGYRDAFMQRAWFWQHPGMAVYFWCVTIACYRFGTASFKKMSPHFADIL